MENVNDKFEWISFEAAEVKAGSGRKVEFPVIIRNIQSKKRKFNISIKTKFSQRDDLIEWFISQDLEKTKEYTVSPKEPQAIEQETEIEPNGSKKFTIAVSTPKGGYMGDELSLDISINSEDQIHSFNKEVKVTLAPVIVALKTTVGNELSVAKDLTSRGEKDKEDRIKINEMAVNEVLAIMSPHDVRGYIFLETMHPDRIPYLARGIRGFKGIVTGDIDIDEIAHYLIPKPAVSGLELGAFVELIDGPFKGEKAKIMSIDASKEEVTVQLIESMVPIPVTVRAEAIRMLERKQQ